MAGLEGLRGLAAAAVLLSHVFLYASPDGGRYDLGGFGVLPRMSGTAGVVLFFTLSGFLLYRPFASAIIGGGPTPRRSRYFRNRLLRIAPGYWFALLGAGLVLRTTYLPALEVDGRSLASDPGVLLANLLLLQSYNPSTLVTGIGPSWSLCVEVVFYLVLPVLAAAAGALAIRTRTGRCRPWLPALSPAVLLVAVWLLGHEFSQALPEGGGGSWSGSWHAVVARSFLVHAGLFAAGLVLAVVQVQVIGGDLRLPRWWRLPVAALALTAVPLLLAMDRRWAPEHLLSLALSLSCAMLLALVVLPQSGRPLLVSVLEVRPLHWAGLVSYGVFLWNEPLVWALQRAGLTFDGTGGFVLALLTTGLAAGTVAAVSWLLVEKPCLALGSARREAHRPGSVVVSEQVDPDRAVATETPTAPRSTSPRGGAR